MMEFIDHGDPGVDERWRRLLGGDPVQRHASLSGAQPLDFGKHLADEDDDPHFAPEDYVPRSVVGDEADMLHDTLEEVRALPETPHPREGV